MPKNVSRGQREPAQPLLPGINLARLLCDSFRLDCFSLRRDVCDYGGAAAEVVELSPVAVPPNSNTGVHHETSNRGAASGRVSD